MTTKPTSSLLIAVLILPLAALAQDTEPTFATDRSLLRRPLVPSEEACPPWVNSTEFRVKVGEASGPLRNNAIGEARANGVATLSAGICEGQETSPRCLAARNNIAPLGSGMWEKRGLGGWACASVAIEEKLLNYQKNELDDLATELDQLAATVRSSVGATPLQLLTPRWQDTGCPAGEVGAHLFTLLQQRLVSVRLLDTSEPLVDARQLRLDISTAGDQVAVSALAKNAGEGTWTPTGAPITFAADLFQLQPDDARTCPAEDDLQLPGGQRPGAAGLEVQLFMAGQAGLFCDGEQATPRIELSAPARLRLYTLQADGQGFQVWPWRSEDDKVYSPAEPAQLPPFTAARSFDGTDSRLVVAAFPVDADDLAPAAFCRLGAPLDASTLTGAAIDSVAYHVAAAGERLCLERGDTAAADADRSHAEAAIRQAPTCSGAR